MMIGGAKDRLRPLRCSASRAQLPALDKTSAIVRSATVAGSSVLPVGHDARLSSSTHRQTAQRIDAPCVHRVSGWRN
jgi:hypothetical protein